MDDIKGGKPAHIFRRILHIAIIFVPLIFYQLRNTVEAKTVHDIIIVAIFFLLFIFEFLRARFPFLLFAQRMNENNRISAFSWTVFSLGMILIFSPSEAYSYAIIVSCALVDPWLGEMRAREANKLLSLAIGITIVFLVWYFAARIYHISPLWAFLMAPLTVALEWFKTAWIDDNALMLLVPLIIVALSH